MKNILEFLEDTLKNYPSKVGFVDSSRESTFYDTAINARRIGSFLLKAGSRRPVIILIGKSINCIEVMFGSLYSNDYYIVADVNSPVNRLESIVSILESPIFVTDYENRELAEKLTDNYFIYEEMIKHDEDNCALKKYVLICVTKILHIFFLHPALQAFQKEL